MFGGTLRVHLAAGMARWPASLPAQTISDPEVAKGIRQVEDGDYDAAIFTLDGAVRRLAADPSHLPDLPQAYLYLGVAFVGKGHEAAAKARFRDALLQIRDLSLSADKYPPKVINLFEAARSELPQAGASPPPPSPSPKAAPAAAPVKKGGSGKALIILGVAAAAAGGVALAAKGGRGSAPPPSRSAQRTTTTFPNEVVVFGGGRDYAITVAGTPTLDARVDWQQDGVLLGMYIVNLANAARVPANGNQTASKQLSLSLPVTPGTHQVSVTNSTGAGPRWTPRSPAR